MVNILANDLFFFLFFFFNKMLLQWCIVVRYANPNEIRRRKIDKSKRTRARPFTFIQCSWHCRWLDKPQRTTLRFKVETATSLCSRLPCFLYVRRKWVWVCVLNYHYHIERVARTRLMWVSISMKYGSDNCSLLQNQCDRTKKKTTNLAAYWHAKNRRFENKPRGSMKVKINM